MPGLFALGMGRAGAGLLDALPTPARLYWDSIIAGNRSPITEANFSESELKAMRELMARGRNGAVQYQDYPGGEAPVGMRGLLTPMGRVANSLGQFKFSTDPQGATITDNYDFNPVYKDQGLLVKALEALGTGGFSPMHMLGEYVMPPGKGRKVNIRLPAP